MGYKLRVSEDASQELDEILEYIAGKLKIEKPPLLFWMNWKKNTDWCVKIRKCMKRCGMCVWL